MHGNINSRIILIDELPFYREGMKQVLEGEENFTVVGEGNYDELPSLVEHTAPDLLIITVDFLQRDQQEFIQELVREYPEVKIVVLFNYHEKIPIISMVESDVKGYLLQEMNERDLIRAINLIVNGIIYLHPKVTKKLIDEVRRVLSIGKNDALVSPSNDIVEPLTKRELEILHLLARGKNTSEIAEKLPITESTVSKYISAILNKLQVEDRTQALIKAVNKGLIDQ